MSSGVYAESTVKPSVLQNRFYEDTDYDKGIRQFCAEKGILYQSFWTLTANGKNARSRRISMTVANVQRLTHARLKTPCQEWYTLIWPHATAYCKLRKCITYTKGYNWFCIVARFTLAGHLFRTKAISSAAQARGITPAEVWFRYLVSSIGATTFQSQIKSRSFDTLPENLSFSSNSKVQRHNIVILTGTKDDNHMKQDLNILQWKLEEEEMKEMDRLIWFMDHQWNYCILVYYIVHCLNRFLRITYS